MNLNQNETAAKSGTSKAESRIDMLPYSSKPITRRHGLTSSAFRPPLSAFTLTELLVVITIIAILAGLAIPAAINALNRAKQARITTELNQLGQAIEQFKIDYGAYPPNVFNLNDITPAEQTLNSSNLVRMLKKISARSTEFQLNRTPNSGQNNVSTILNVGISPAEAVVFWLQGFSSDPQRPLSGTDLSPTSIEFEGTPILDVLTIDSFTPKYDFDRSRLRISKDSMGNRRFLEIYDVNGNGPFQLQLYEYLPAGSQEPFVYFDTSRETPLQVVNNWQTTEFFYSSTNSAGNIYPLKQMKPNAPTGATSLEFAEYVNQRKFQLLHCGIDDAWGDFSGIARGQLDLTVDQIPGLLFPEGPFIGDIADTLLHSIGGTLEAEQE